MGLLALPIAIRRTIYAHLLVDPNPISFLPEFLDEWTTQTWPEETSLFPDILYANKQIHNEAVELLYGHNLFLFAELDATSNLSQTSLAVFLRQIGAKNARLLRHIAIDFPTAPLAQIRNDKSGESLLQGDMGLDNIDLLLDACSGLAALDMSLPLERTDFVLENTALFTKFLDVLQTRLQAFPSLAEIKVDVTLMGWDLNGEGSNDDQWRSHRESVQNLCGHGWTVTITKIPIQASQNQNFW